MNGKTLWLAFGTALGFAGAFGGIGAFLIVLVVGLCGWLVGRWLDGELDLSALTERSRDRDRARW